MQIASETNASVENALPSAEINYFTIFIITHKVNIQICIVMIINSVPIIENEKIIHIIN